MLTLHTIYRANKNPPAATTAPARGPLVIIAGAALPELLLSLLLDPSLPSLPSLPELPELLLPEDPPLVPVDDAPLVVAVAPDPEPSVLLAAAAAREL